jgi:hypothetical protein
MESAADDSLGKDDSLSKDASLGKDASLSPDASLPAAQQVQANDANPAPPGATSVAHPGTPDATSVAPPGTPDATSVAPPGTPDATKAVPVDANYSAFLGAVVHALAELYGIKDDAKVVITSNNVSAANFTATIEVKDGKLTITLTPVDNSAGTAALESIKLKLEAPKPEVVSPAPAEVQAPAPAPAEVQAPAPAVVSPEAAGAAGPAGPAGAAGAAVSPAEVQAPTSPAVVSPEVVSPALESVDSTRGGYRRRKRNLRTIKKQQQRNRKTMNKH